MNSQQNLQSRLEFNQIDRETRALLARHKTFIMSELTKILDQFYEHVSQYKSTLAFFKNKDHMMSAKNAQLRHWSTIMDGKFDEAYEVSSSGSAKRIIALAWTPGGTSVATMRWCLACCR